MAEGDPPECEVKDFQFRSAAKFRLQPSVDTIPGERLSLLAVSNKYGLIFVGYNDGFKVLKSSDIITAALDVGSKSFVEDLSDWSTVKTLAPPTHLAVSSDNLTLAVCSKKHGLMHVDMFDVRAFSSQRAEPGSFLEVKLSGADVDVLDFCWNPGQDFSSLCAVCLSDASVAIYDIRDHLKIVASAPKGIDAKCLCWSPKGKQLVVGKSDGSLAQYDQGLSKKKDFSCPNIFNGSPVTAVDLLWESTHVFLVAYEPLDNTDREQPSVVMVTSSKEGRVTYTSFEDPCFGGGEERAHKVYMNIIPDWDVIVMSSANALEAAVLGRQEHNKTGWERWNLDDTARAELPLREDYTETYPVGMAIDFTSQQDIPLGDNRVHPPSPILIMLSTDGALVTFHMVNSRPDAKTLTTPPATLSAQGLRPSLAPVATPAKTPTPQAPPTKADSTPAARSLFTAQSLKEQTSAPSAIPSKTNLFGTKSLLSGNQSFNLGQPLNQSTPHPNAFTKSTTKPQIVQTPQLPQPVFGQQPKSPSATTKFSLGDTSGFQVGSKSTTESKATQGFSFAVSSQGTKSQGQTTLTLGTSQGQAVSVSGPKVANQTSGLFGSLTTANSKPTAPGGLSGFGSSLSVKPASPSAQQPKPTQQSTQQQQIKPQQPASPQQPQQQQTRSQPPKSAATQQEPISKATNMDGIRLGSGKSSTGTPPPSYQPASPKQVEVAHHRPQPVQASARVSTPIQETPGPAQTQTQARQPSTQATDSQRGDDPFAKAISEEVAKFERELQTLLTADVSINIGSKSELQDLRRGTEEMRSFLSNARDTTQSVNSDIHELKGRCLDSFALLEECRLRADKSRTGNNKHQPHRGLDPVSDRQMTEIRACYQSVDSAIRDIDLKLDTQWEAYQNGKNKRRMQAPVTDTIYRTLNANQKVISEQSRSLERLCDQLKDVHMYNVTSNWDTSDTVSRNSRVETQHRVSNHGNTPTQSRRSTGESWNGALDHSDLNLSVGGMSPEKSFKLRDFLGNRRVTPIKCKNTSLDLSRSVLIQSPERPPRPQRPAPTLGGPMGSTPPAAFQTSLVPPVGLATPPRPQDRAAAGASFWGMQQPSSPRSSPRGLGSDLRSQPQRSPHAVNFPGIGQAAPQMSGQQALASLLGGGQQIHVGGALASAMFGSSDGEKTESLGFSTPGFGQTHGSPFGRNQDSFAAPASPPKPTTAPASATVSKPKASQSFNFNASPASPSFNLGKSTTGKPTPGKPVAGKSTGFSFGGATSLDKVTFGATSTSASTGFTFGAPTPTSKKDAPTITTTVRGSPNQAAAEVKSSKPDRAQAPLPFVTQAPNLITKPVTQASSMFPVSSARPSKDTADVKSSDASTPSPAAFVPNEMAQVRNTAAPELQPIFPARHSFTAPAKATVEQTVDTSTTLPSSQTDNIRPPDTQASTVEDATQEQGGKAFTSGFSFKPMTQSADSSSDARKAAFSFAETNQDNSKPSEESKIAVGASSTSRAADSTTDKASFSFANVNQTLDDKDTAPKTGFSAGFSFTTPAQGGSVFGGGSPGAAPTGTSVFAGLGGSSLFGRPLTPVSASQGGGSGTMTTAEASKPQTTTSPAGGGGGPSPDRSKTLTSSAPVTGDKSVPVDNTSTPATTGTTPAAPIFAQTSATDSVSGQSATSLTATSSVFGTTAGTSSLFGQTVTSTSVAVPAPLGQTPAVTSTAAVGFSFGAAASANATTTTPGSLFGQFVQSASSMATPSVFGQQAPTSTTSSIFGQQTPGSSIFGQPAASSSTATNSMTTVTTPASSGVFGQSASSGVFGQSASSVFGQPASFGSVTSTAATAPSVFGGTASSTASTTTQGIFGQSATPTAGFGQAGSKLFGTTPQTTQSSVFGGSQAAVGSSSVFGASTQSSSSFGSGTATSQAGGPGGFGSGTATGFGATQQEGSMFGTPTTKAADTGATFGGSGLFGGLGGKPSAENANKNVFGGSSTFGAGTQQSSSLFGGGSTSGFGYTATPTASDSGTFSSGSNVAGTGFGGFQQTTQQTPKSAGGFGAAPAFGASPAFAGSPAFGGGANFGSGATFSSPFGGGAQTGAGSAGAVFGSGAAASPQQTGAFSGFANAGSPTFGALAQTGGNTSFGGGGGGFGGQSQGFGQPQSPGGTSFTSYRS